MTPSASVMRSTRWCGTRATPCVGQSPRAILWRKQASPSRSRSSPTSGGADPFLLTPSSSTGSCSLRISHWISVTPPCHLEGRPKRRNWPTRPSSTNGRVGDWFVTSGTMPTASPAGAVRSVPDYCAAERSHRPCGDHVELRWLRWTRQGVNAVAGSFRSYRPSWRSTSRSHWHDGKADLHGPAPSSRIGERRPQRILR